MSDTAFRDKQEPAKEPVSSPVEKVSVSTTKVEPPYLDYESQSGKPYLADLFELGDYWNDPKGGFEKEVRQIEEYIADQVTNREIENSLSSVKKRLKEIEKVTNMDKEDRKVVKLEILAEYVKFLTKRKDVEHNITRYGNN